MASSAKDIQLRELKDTISQLNTIMSEQTELIRSLRTIIEEKTAHEMVLQEQVDYLTKKLFGSSSEKTPADIPGQLNLFNEAEVYQDPELPEEDCSREPRPRKKKATHAELFKGLKVHKEVIPLDEEDKVCPVCGSPMERIGEEYVRRELVFTPAKCEVYEYYTESYGCPDCKEGKGDTEKSVIVKSKVPPALIGKGPASSSTVAWTIYQKYANGMPLYRQEKDWKEYGAAVSRTTLANWIIYSAGHYFRPLYDYFHRQLLLREFLMADETRVQVLKEPGRSAESQSFMWLYRTGEDGLPVILLYGYTPTRSGDNAADFLDGFQGYLETDGYQGYNKVSGIKRCSCWASPSCGCTAPGKMVFRSSCCMDIPRRGAETMQQTFWTAFRDIWKPTVTRGITRYPASNGAPAGHISADTLWMRSRKESSWITTSRQYRECITATAWQDWKAAFPVSAERIMKKGNKCVSRRKNRFSRPFGRGLTARSQSATPAWIKH